MKSFSTRFNFRRNIESHPAVDNEGEVVSWRNVVQSKKICSVKAKTTESELCSIMQPKPQQSKSRTIYMSRMLIPHQHILIQLYSNIKHIKGEVLEKECWIKLSFYL